MIKLLKAFFAAKELPVITHRKYVFNGNKAVMK